MWNVVAATPHSCPILHSGLALNNNNNKKKKKKKEANLLCLCVSAIVCFCLLFSCKPLVLT